MLFVKIAHEKLLDLQTARIPPRSPIRNAYVPVPPASPVVSVSRNSHFSGFPSAARHVLLRETFSSRFCDKQISACREASANSGVGYQLRTARCSPNRLLRNARPNDRASVSSVHVSQSTSSNGARARRLSAASRENLCSAASRKNSLRSPPSMHRTDRE